MIKYIYFLAFALAFMAAPISPDLFAQDFVGNSFNDLGGAANEALGNAENPGNGGVVNQYSKKYQKSQNPIELHSGLLPDATYNMFFAHKEGTRNDQATLHLSSPFALNGCVKMRQPSAETRRNGSVFFIDITDAVVGVDRSVRYSHFECKQGSHVAQLDITLDRDEFIDNDVRTIIMKTGAFTDYFDVEVSEAALTLKPRSSNAFTPFKKPGIKDPLHFVFYPDNLVVLSVPQSAGEKELSQQVHIAAKQEGLTPAKDANIKLNIDQESAKNFYFVDEKREFAQKLKNDGQILFGQIHVPEILYGPNGPYEVPKKLDVYAHLPH